MNGPPSLQKSFQPARGSPPILPFFLLAAGLACGAAAAWLKLGDPVGLVERQIARAHGIVSPGMADRLRNGLAIPMLLAAGLILVVLGALAGVCRAALGRRLAAVDLQDAPGAAVRSPWRLPLLAGVGALAYFSPTLWHGYFRYDDFEILSVAQAGPLRAAIWQPHGDHFMPLTRIFAFFAFRIFGVTAWPYNLCELLCFCGALVAGLLLLDELGISRPARLVFAALVVFWSPWAEMMSGYYILSTYLLIAALGLAGTRYYLRWGRSGRTADAIKLLLCLGTAPLIDISGYYVIGACGAFGMLDLARNWFGAGVGPWPRRHWWLLAGLALATAANGAIAYYAYRVAHPGSFLAMAGEGNRTLARLIAEWVYLFGAGLLLSMATPFVYARLPAGLLGGLAVTAFISWLAFFLAAVRAADRPRRRALAAILVVVLGVCLMVVLGRHSAGTLAVRWPAKHIGPAYLWLCLLWAVAWDALWQKTLRSRRLVAAELTLVALGGFASIQALVGSLGLALAFPPFGYYAELRDADRRRAAVEVLQRQVVGVMATHLDDSAAVPTLDGNYIRAAFPSLFSYNLSHYRPFFPASASGLELVRNAAMQSWHTEQVRTVPILAKGVSPAFLSLLREDAGLRAFYFASVPLEPRKDLAADSAARRLRDREDGGVVSDGATAVVLREAAWTPESTPILRLAIQASDGAPPEGIPVTVIFWNEIMSTDWQGTLVLPPGRDGVTEVDLRQVYAFSLSARVANLRIVLTRPGRYRIPLAEIAP